MSERELPMLAAIGGFFRWWEELLNIIAAPLLMAGLLIALVALLTNGSLLTTQPELVYAWAIAMGVGVDAQLIGASAKLGQAALNGRPWQVVGYTALVLPLAYVAFVAAQVFATQQAEGITTSAALAQLGMDPTAWLIQRSALSVALVVLSGILRYRSKGQATIADERAKLDRELELEPLRAQVRMRKALGWRNVAATAFAKDVQNIPQTIPERPPTGPGTPQAAARLAPDTAPDTLDRTWEEQAQQPLHVMPRRMTAADQRAVRKRTRLAGLRAAAFDALDHDPTMSRKALRSILNCAQTLANELYSAWVQSREREEVAQ